MKVWITSFLLIFGAAELYQWAKDLTLPMPIFILGGAFLAIASNYNKLSNLPFHLDYQAPDTQPQELPANQSPGMAPPTGSVVNPAIANAPISFEIRKPFKPID